MIEKFNILENVTKQSIGVASPQTSNTEPLQKSYRYVDPLIDPSIKTPKKRSVVKVDF